TAPVRIHHRRLARRHGQRGQGQQQARQQLDSGTRSWSHGSLPSTAVAEATTHYTQVGVGCARRRAARARRPLARRSRADPRSSAHGPDPAAVTTAAGRSLLVRLAEGPVSGDALAREAGQTRAAVWK